LEPRNIYLESPVSTELLPKVDVYRLSSRARQDLAELVTAAVREALGGQGRGYHEKPQPAALGAYSTAAYLGISRSLLYELRRRDPAFPQPAKLGRRRLWLVSDLDDYAKMQRLGEAKHDAATAY
jgi:predicted DNA-binding transcriptional regulator AlpA